MSVQESRPGGFTYHGPAQQKRPSERPFHQPDATEPFDPPVAAPRDLNAAVRRNGRCEWWCLVSQVARCQWSGARPVPCGRSVWAKDIVTYSGGWARVLVVRGEWCSVALRCVVGMLGPAPTKSKGEPSVPNRGDAYRVVVGWGHLPCHTPP